MSLAKSCTNLDYWDGGVGGGITTTTSSIDADLLAAMEGSGDIGGGALSTSLDMLGGSEIEGFGSLIDGPTITQGIPPSAASSSQDQHAAATAANSTRRSVLNAMRNALHTEGPLALGGRRRGLRSTQLPPAPGGSSGSDEMFTSYIMQLANQPPSGAGGPGAHAFEAITNSINASNRTAAAAAAGVGGRGGPSPLRNKIVYQLECAYCCQRVCHRAMKAILLADTKIELYSTDIPPAQLVLMDEDRMTQGCHCRIRDTVCVGCGNVLGYHVSQPCSRCLDAKNNGHFWMFYSETIRPAERLDERTGKKLCWGALSPMRDGEESLSYITRVGDGRLYEMYCR